MCGRARYSRVKLGWSVVELGRLGVECGRVR